MNQITSIHVYSSGSTQVSAPELDDAEGLIFSTYYPGGIFGAASFTIKRKVTEPLNILPGYRIKFYNGFQCIWEGRITGWAYDVGSDGQGITVNCMGYWADVLMLRSWRKPWAETNIDESVWQQPTSAADANDQSMRTEEKSLVSIDRNDRIRFIPKPLAWATNQFVRLKFTAPTGETVKRITFDNDLQEGVQAWTIGIYNVTTSLSDWTRASTGSGSVDETLATPSQEIWLYMSSKANQTPPDDGSIYGEFSNVVVYTETGAINITEIAKDVRGHVTELSAYEGEIDSNTYSLVPFISDGETIADLLNRAAGYGEATTFYPWACGIRESDIGADDKPVLYCELQPLLTDYEYVIMLDDPALSDVTFEQDVSEVRNWISYEYTSIQGIRVVVTPDDDATLKDATSITNYGERHEHLSINITNAGPALTFARRYLRTKKSLMWTASGGIPVTGTIQKKTGETWPVSQIRAGERLRIANFLDDLSGTGLTFLITATDYEDDSQTTTITVGRPDYLIVGLQSRIDDGRKLR